MKCISHEVTADKPYESIKQRLWLSRPQDPVFYDQALAMLAQLHEFPLGRFLIEQGGLDGFWTRYVITQGTMRDAAQVSELETWLLKECPCFKATQQRFSHFAQIIQQRLRSNMRLASIPCGAMDDLLCLDYTGLSGIVLTGIDIDQKSIALAAENAQLRGLSDVTDFILADAWSAPSKNGYDLITSNGLNIYEPDEQRHLALYQKFYNLLKDDGLLVTSFLTPPIGGTKPSPWRDVKKDDLEKQRMIFSDILQIKWQVFYTEDEFALCLNKAGFEVQEIIYDSSSMFPTVVACKAPPQRALS